MANHEAQEPDRLEEAPDRDSLRRALHNLEAAQARVSQRAALVYEEQRRDLVADLLPVLEGLTRTLDAARATSDASLVDGVRMVLSDLDRVMARYGLERSVDAAGQPFDPAIHEAVAAVPVFESDLVGRVMNQASPGYRFHGKLLRAARVSVGVDSRSRADRATPSS